MTRWLAAIVLGLSATTAAAQPSWSAVRALVGDGGVAGALLMDIDDGRVLAEFNPHQRLIPASISKLYISAEALRRYGPDHRFETALWSEAPVQKGVLKGDLVYLGAGDPDLDDRALWALVSRLRQAGIHRITGHLRINDSRFGVVPCETDDRCDALLRSGHAFDAPLSSAAVNYATVEVAVTPGAAPGKAATVTLQPPSLTWPEVDAAVTTSAPGKRSQLRLWRDSGDEGERIMVRGTVPAGAPTRRWSRSISLPARHTGALLESLLRDAGIRLDGELRVESRPLDGGYRKLAQVHGRMLAEQIHSMNRYSNNFMADTLTLQLAADAGPGLLRLSEAANGLNELLRTAAATAGVPVLRAVAGDSGGPLRVDSGSGLTVSSRVSAADTVALLSWVYHQHALFPAFIGSLPVPRYTHSRLLAGGDDNWQQRVAAKTGTLTEPVSVRSLAGYVRLKQGGWGAFAVIINGSAERRVIPGPHAMAAIREDLELLLARH